MYGVFAFLTASPQFTKAAAPWRCVPRRLCSNLVGAGLMLIAVFSYRSLKQEAALKEANRDAP